MQLNETDQKKVDAIKAEMKELSPKMWALKPYTRPLGKSQVPFNVAQLLEKRYGEYDTKLRKLDSKLRKIYRANGMEHI